jgi:hypothetical protein
MPRGRYFRFILVPLMMAWFMTFVLAPILDILEQRPLIVCGLTFCKLHNAAGQIACRTPQADPDADGRKERGILAGCRLMLTELFCLGKVPPATFGHLGIPLAPRPAPLPLNTAHTNSYVFIFSRSHDLPPHPYMSCDWGAVLTHWGAVLTIHRNTSAVSHPRRPNNRTNATRRRRCLTGWRCCSPWSSSSEGWGLSLWWSQTRWSSSTRMRCSRPSLRKRLGRWATASRAYWGCRSRS